MGINPVDTWQALVERVVDLLRVSGSINVVRSADKGRVLRALETVIGRHIVNKEDAVGSADGPLIAKFIG